MVWTIARKELLTNLLTLRLSVALVCAVLLSGLTAFIGSVDFSLRVDAYERQAREIDDKLDSVTIWSQVEPDIILRPSPLTILSPGIAKNIDSRFNVRLWNKHGGPAWGFGIVDSGFMKTLVQIDFVTVVAVVLSFLAIALGYDAVAGEREQGTLRQILVNSVARGELLTGKLLGGCLSLWAPFALSYGLAVLIMLANDDVHLTTDDWARLAGLFALACLFLAQTFALALAVSTFARAASTSLIVCLFGWLTGGVVYMNALPSLVQHAVVEKPFEDFQAGASDTWDRHGGRVGDWEERNPPPPPAYSQYHAPGGGLLRYGHRRYYDWRARQSEVAVESGLQAADEAFDLLMDNQEPLYNEAYYVDELSLLSPLTNFQVLSYALTQTTLRDKYRLTTEGIAYRSAYLDHLRREGVFGSWRWFTDDGPEQEGLVPDPASVTEEMLRPESDFMRQRLAWAIGQEETAARTRQPLDLSRLPPFPGAGTFTWAETLGRLAPGMAVMVLTLAAALLAATARFLRYDPT